LKGQGDKDLANTMPSNEGVFLESIEQERKKEDREEGIDPFDLGIR
jgi:hypothetical protein